MNILDESTLAHHVKELYAFFSLWDIINTEVYEGEVTRLFVINNHPTSGWVSVAIETTDATHTVPTFMGLKRDYRRLTLDGNTRDGRYVLDLPKHPCEEDRAVRNLMHDILTCLKHHPTKRGQPIVITEKYPCYMI